jgi:hypothetical protein
MEKKLKCIACGCLITLMASSDVYFFVDNHCKDCRDKLEKQPHNVENNLPTNARQIYVAGLSGTAYTIDTSTNWFD